MEFWGVEVKAGQPLKVKPTFDSIIHLSQASLGESKKQKGHESVPLYVKFGDKNLVLGTLVPENIPQLSFDLVFEKEFELSHNWKNGSVYFIGYQTSLPQDSSDEFDMEDSDEEEGEELPAIPAAENGKAGQKAEKAKAATPKADSAKPATSKADTAKPIKDVKPEEDDDDESDDEDDSDNEMIDGDVSNEISGEDDSSDEDDVDDSEDEDSDDEEETPKKAEVGKKRAPVSAPKTPVPAKKSKTPMTDGKKGGHVHVATPYPSKGVKTPNAKTQTPKSGGHHTCSSCSKTFNSDNALQSHIKAKHSAK